MAGLKSAPRQDSTGGLSSGLLYEFRFMATVAEEKAAAAVVGAGEVAEEKVDEVKEAGTVEVEVKKAEEGQGEQGKERKKPRSRKPRSAGPHHPPYFEMIKEAIMALDGNGKAGSSPYAIAKHMGEQHREVLPANYRKVLAVQLRSFAAKGRLVRVKASFKLAPAEEKKAAAAAKKRRPTPSAKKKAAPARPSARAKRAKAKKAAPAKPKQPRSIRTGVAKKANKASA